VLHRRRHSRGARTLCWTTRDRGRAAVSDGAQIFRLLSQVDLLVGADGSNSKVRQEMRRIIEESGVPGAQAAAAEILPEKRFLGVGLLLGFAPCLAPIHRLLFPPSVTACFYWTLSQSVTLCWMGTSDRRSAQARIHSHAKRYFKPQMRPPPFDSLPCLSGQEAR